MARRTLKSALRATALSARACCSKIRDFRKKLISQTQARYERHAQSEIAYQLRRSVYSSRQELEETLFACLSDLVERLLALEATQHGAARR